ncbi:hypothetical protein SAMN06297382_0591 [Amphiplicatus metriothermophilus]|uniref:Uncharacterized protein n=1 Tax=Amphiplicatus metriothermophilus TaxID=1519374 RepID=A0A239PKI5_9PROT|nr:hypothetical protein [Amphiplicatus metriothermophilus]SNT68095.1 hypothetical protein SAMN06297382_0591 [Amphiplicatus metriothermophilus]
MTSLAKIALQTVITLVLSGFAAAALFAAADYATRGVVV